MSEMSRCDASESEAATTMYIKPSKDGYVMFCDHHSREHGPALIAAGWAAYDKSDLSAAINAQRQAVEAS